MPIHRLSTLGLWSAEQAVRVLAPIGVVFDADYSD
jgi:hypothetical protein